MQNKIKQLKRGLSNFYSTVLNVNSDSLAGLELLPIETILDVGANEGQSSKVYRKIFPDAQIYAFEPLSAPFAKLDTWAKTQGGKVITTQSAIGNVDGSQEMVQHVDFSPASSLLETTSLETEMYPISERQESVSVSVRTLDSFFEDTPLIEPIFLKIDVQGYEIPVLKGSVAMLENITAILVEICLQPLYVNQSKFSDVCAFLDSHGFSYAGNLSQIPDSAGRYVYVDAIFLNRKKVDMLYNN